MTRISVAPGTSINCEVDDYLWPWTVTTPVLMMHGIARNASFWNRWVPTIAQERRVYRPELRGCGQSDLPPADYRFSGEDIVHDVLAVLDAFGLERVHWVGESSGGLIGTYFAFHHPERIASLVLCNSPVKISEWNIRTYALDAESPSAAIRKYGVGEWTRQTLQYRLDLKRASTELQAWHIEEMAKNHDYVVAALMESFQTFDTGPMLGRIEAPVLVMGGDGSKLSAEAMATMVAGFPNAHQYTFEGYGHGVTLLEPERCALAAAAFWQSIDHIP